MRSRPRDPVLHRLTPDGLAKPQLAVEQGEDAAVDHGFGGDAEMHLPEALILQVARRADDAVAVMARQIGAGQVRRDPPRFLRLRPSCGKDGGDEVDQSISANPDVLSHANSPFWGATIR